MVLAGEYARLVCPTRLGIAGIISQRHQNPDSRSSVTANADHDAHFPASPVIRSRDTCRLPVSDPARGSGVSIPGPPKASAGTKSRVEKMAGGTRGARANRRNFFLSRLGGKLNYYTGRFETLKQRFGRVFVHYGGPACQPTWGRSHSEISSAAFFALKQRSRGRERSCADQTG